MIQVNNQQEITMRTLAYTDDIYCERNPFFKYTVILALRVFWCAHDILGAYHVPCSFSVLFKSGFFYCWCK